jgi:hypothetical protein
VAVLRIDVLGDDLAAAGPKILTDRGGHDLPPPVQRYDPRS